MLGTDTILAGDYTADYVTVSEHLYRFVPMIPENIDQK